MATTDDQYHAIGNNVASEEAVLLPYRNIQGRMIAALSLLIPFGTIIFFVAYCAGAEGKYELDTMVEISGFLRVVYILHGAYFIILPFSFELTIEDLPLPFVPAKYKFGKIPPRPDNLFWMMSCLSGELFFVTAVILFLLASQSNVPRWTLILPMAQCAYNMKNSLFWVFLGNVLSPIRQRVSIMILDFVLIGFCFVVYIVHFFSN